MDNDKRLPPDVPSNEDEIDRATGSVAARAADLANRTAETVKDGYGRAKEKLAEIDPQGTLRDAGRYAQETSEAAVETVNRHPLAAFAVGAGTGAVVAGPVGAVVGGAAGAVSAPAVVRTTRRATR